MKQFSYLMSAAAALLLGGCSWLSDNALYGESGLIRDRAQDYEATKVLPPLQVPAHLDRGAIRDLLVVPEVGTVASRSEQDFEVPRPDFFYAEAGNDVVNLAREGRDKYIIIDEPINEVWQKLGDFWSYNSIAVELSDPAQGLMETAWITEEREAPGFFTRLLKKATFQDVEGPYRDKLRVRVARADDNQRTAVRMDHLRLSEKQAAEPLDWTKTSRNVDYQSEMMYAMLHYLNKTTSTTTARSLKAQQQRGVARGLLGRDSLGNPVLKLSTHIDQAWQWVDQAMVAAQMDVGSADKGIGKYYITYTTSSMFEDESEGEGGFWSFINWLHGDREAITIDTQFLESALGLDSGEADDEVPVEQGIRYSAKDTPEVDPDDLSQQEGYKIWLGGKVIYVFQSGDSNVVRNEETGTLEHTGHYQVRLNRRSNGVYVSVLTDAAEPAPGVVAEEILWNIKDHLPSG